MSPTAAPPHRHRPSPRITSRPRHLRQPHPARSATATQATTPTSPLAPPLATWHDMAPLQASSPRGSPGCAGPAAASRRTTRQARRKRDPPAFVARVHGRSIFAKSLRQARAVLAAWQRDYDEVRPHSAHGGLAPALIRLPSCSPASSPLRAGFADGLRPDLTQAARDDGDGGGRGGKRCSTERRNTVTMGVTATRDSASDWREEGAQVKTAQIGSLKSLAGGAGHTLVLARLERSRTI